MGLDWDLERIVADVEAGVDLSGLWGEQELKELLKGLQEPPTDPGPQIDRAEELREKWQTERGQVWEIGRHRLMCGDSTSEEDVGRLMAGNKVGAVVTDPPYGIGYRSNQPAFDGGTRFIERTFGQDVLDTSWLVPWSDVADQDACMYVFTRWDVLPALWRAIEAIGFEIRQRLIWDKSHWTMGNLDYYGTQTEDIIFATKGHPVLTWMQRRGNLIKTPTITYSPDSRTGHATQKPIAAVSPWIEDSVPLGGLAVDPFLGSGTTMVAAEQLDRICYGMEIEPKYVAVTLERMAGMGLEPRLLNPIRD